MALRPNTTYYYRVKAITASAESEYSNVIPVTTLSDNNFSVIDPLSATTPSVAYIKTTTNSAELYLNIFPAQEVIEDIKVTLSTNSDYSSPLYSDLTFIRDKNTAIAVRNNDTYIALTLQNLDPNTNYYGRVRVSNKNSISGYITFTLKTVPTLASPLALGVTNLTAITATINWTSAVSATSYTIDVATDANFSTLIITDSDVGNNTSYNIPVLIENTTYFYRVRAKLSGNASLSSNIISFTTLDDIATYAGLTIALTAPVIREVRNIKNNEFELIWNPIDYAENYRVDISITSDFSTFVVENTVTTDNKYKATSLSANTLYYFRVRANHPSNSSTFTVRPINTLAINGSLNPPQALIPSTLFSTGFIFTWVKRTYANRYYLELSTASGFSSILRTVYTNDIDSFLFDNLVANTVYYVRLYALSSTQISNVSNAVTLTTNTALPAITLNSPSELSESSVRLNWVVNAAYNKYLLSIYKQSDSSNFLGDGFYNLRDIGNTSNYFLDIFLEPSTIYNYIITGITASNDRKTSAVGSFTTQATAPIISFNNDGKSIEWSGILNRLEVATDKNFKFMLQGWNPRTIVSSNNKFDIFNLLLENTDYYFRGYNSLGGLAGVRSNILSAYTANPILLAPDLTSTTVFLRWKKNSSKLYRVQVKQFITGSYVPITGHTFPVAVGDTDSFYIQGLTADTDYSCTIQYYIETQNKYSDMSLPLYFHTRKYSNYANFIATTTENGGLTAVNLDVENTSFDRCTLTITGGSYSSYAIAVSRRSDFLTIDKFIELTDRSYTFIGLPNTTYLFRLYGISGTTRTTVNSDAVVLDALPTLSADLSGTPVISSITILNENEAILNWSAISGATGYEIQISKSNTFEYLEKNLVVDFLDTTQALISSLVGTLTYYVRLYGFNAHSISGISSTSTIDTTP